MARIVLVRLAESVGDSTSPSRRRPVKLMALAFFAIVASMGVMWALASPIFSVPDENAHATKAIAVVRGQLSGHPMEGQRHPVVDLPHGYDYSQDILCYALHPDVTANCDFELGDAGGQPFFGTWVANYNPLYYALVGWPSLFLQSSAGIYGMRIVSVIIGSALLGWAFGLALGRARSRWLPLALAFVATPTVLYLMGSVNPNGLEIAAGVTLWVAVLRLFDAFSAEDRSAMRSVWPLWLAATVSAVILANVRALGPLWALVVVALVAVVSGWSRVRRLFMTRSSYWWIVGIVVAGAFSLLWTQSGGSLSGQAEASDAPLVGGSFVSGFVWILKATPDLLQQVFGYFGWFDALPPTWSYWLIAGVITVLLVLAFTAVRRRSVLVLGTALVGAVLIPALVQGYSVHQTGIIWQGRYFLFYYLGVLIIAAWNLSSRDGWRVDFLVPRITWIGSSLLALYGLVVFFFVLRRYVVGAEHPVGMMWKNPAWQPPLTWPVLMAVFTVFSAALVFVVSRAASMQPTQDDEGARSVTRSSRA